MNIRPSNIIRGIENIAIGTGKLVATGASHVAQGATHKVHEVRRAFRVEYAARKLMALREGIEEAVEEIEAMTPAQRAQHEADTIRVGERLDELTRAKHLRQLAKRAAARAKLYR